MKHLFALCLLAAFISIPALAGKKPSWALQGSESTINTPESAYFETQSRRIYVSNVVGSAGAKDGKGWISVLDESGKLIKDKWVDGIDAPKGLRSKGDDLWVTNIDEVVRIDIPSASIKERVKVEGAKFLNDNAIGADGTVWVSDTMTSTIYEIKDGKASVLVKGEEWENPNGLLWQESGRLIVAGWGRGIAADFSTKTLGNLYSIDLKTKKKSLITRKPLGHLDGLESDGNGGYLVSDWMAGKVFRVSAKGNVRELVSGFKHAADIGYIPDTKLLLVPDMGASVIKAYLGL